MQVTLNRNSWHRRLQRYVLNIKTDSREDFPNLCPYFWLTIFCLFAVPFVWLVKCPVYYLVAGFFLAVAGFFRSIELMVDVIAVPTKKYVCEPLDKFFVESRIAAMTPEQVVKTFKSHKKRDNAVWKRWKDLQGEDCWAKFKQYEDEYNAQRKAEADRQAKEEHERMVEEWKAKKAREARLMKIANATQKAAPFILGAVLLPLAAGLIWLLYQGALLVSKITVPWDKVLNVLLIALKWGAIGVGGLIAAVAIGLFLWTLFKTIFSKCWILFCTPFQSPLCKRVGKSIGSVLVRFVFNPVGGVAIGIGTAVGDAFSLFGQYLKATKDGYCPRIEWKE